MSSDEVMSLERNAWSMFAMLGSGPGGRVVDSPHRLIIETPVPQPPYNMVARFLDDGDQPITSQVDEILDRFRGRDVVMTWLVHPTTPSDVRQALSERGYVSAEEIYGMAADAEALAQLPSDPMLPDDVEVAEALDDRHDDWLHLVSWRYGLDSGNSEYLDAMFSEVLRQGSRVWVARIDGRPTSKVGLHVDDEGVAGIYGVVTTEEGRGRGLAYGLTVTALRSAMENGANRAVLHSTPMARSLYRRLGFHDVATFEIWAEPDQVHL